MLEQAAIHISDASGDQAAEELRMGARLPEARLSKAPTGKVALRSGLFKERRELTKAYVYRLRTENLLQNHLLEACVRIDRPAEDMHQGWEAPHCQLRGHFLGHWLSSASHFAATDGDKVFAARASEVVDELGRCQELNGGRWLGSIPEKYFDLLPERSWSIWSPQYTLHKTMMGLFDAYAYSKDPKALELLGASADWFVEWSDALVARGRGDAVYRGECSGMLELWADLYAETKEPKYLKLISRYAMPDIFKKLLAGADPLSNNHANASVPWIQGAARLYEVSGDERYREVVERFWKLAVEERGMFATTGSNAGEFWVPAGEFDRFLGDRTQEHCTVYNMIRVAQYLFRWTGEAKYADYIERALYNGVLAQQHPATGAISYFLPMRSGAKKRWGSETKDFWCCHGTLVQAQAMYEDLIYYAEPGGLVVAQFIASRAELELGGARALVEQSVDWSDGTANFARRDGGSALRVELKVSSEGKGSWRLKVRRPEWAAGPASASVNGEAVATSISKSGFIEIERAWGRDTVRLVFPKRVRKEGLPGDQRRFALLDGPVVLAALADRECEIPRGEEPVPQYEHQYVNGRDWRFGRYRLGAVGGGLELVPLYEVADESYCVYFSEKE